MIFVITQHQHAFIDFTQKLQNLLQNSCDGSTSVSSIRKLFSTTGTQPLSTPQFSCPSCKDSRGRGCERALSKVASPTTLSQRPSVQISSVYSVKLGFERGGFYMPTITNLLIVCLSGLHTPHLLHLLAGYITNTYPIEIIYSFLMSYLEENYSPNLLCSLYGCVHF